MIDQDLLGQFAPLHVLERQFLAQAAKVVRVAEAKKGTIIFKRGKILTDLYFLIEGEVDLIDNEFGVEKVRSGSDRAVQALNQQSPTVVSAIAKAPVKFFTISASRLDNLLSCSQTPLDQEGAEGSAEDGIEVCEAEGGQDWMSSLLQSPLLSRVPLPLLQELFQRFEKIDVKEGEKIIREGAPGDYFYVLASGRALVTNRLGTVDLELQPGQYFGEEALLSSAPRNATVTMTSGGVVKRLSAEDFEALLKKPVLQQVDAEQLDSLTRPYKLLDVRMPMEFRAQSLPGSINIPLSRLRKNISELSAGNVYLVSDEAGTRADIAVYILCQAGLDARILKKAHSLLRLESVD